MLNVTGETLEKYIDNLGIRYLIQENISDTHLKEIKKLHGNDGHLKKGISQETEDFYLEIDENDINELRKLKMSYNKNLRLINAFEQNVESCLNSDTLPEKFIIDNLEKYIKLNIQLLKSMQMYTSNESNLEQNIINRLKLYE